MLAEKRLAPAALEILREAIDDADGNEVFALGWFPEKIEGDGAADAEAKIVRIKIFARGDEKSVLANGDFFERFEDSNDDDDGLDVPDVFIHNHPSGFLTPSDADMYIAGRAAESGVGCYIIDNEARNVYVVAEPIRRRKRLRLDADALCAELEEGGRLARALPAYEKRDAQLALIRLVSRAFNEDAIAAAEAGTGVGKSFAYLLPSIEFAVNNSERVVISTATINLQQQLFEKDIPLVAKTSGKKVRAAIMKGRGNYLCLRRLDEALAEQPSLDETENAQLQTIAAWAETTQTGERSEINFATADSTPEKSSSTKTETNNGLSANSGLAVWSRVCSEGDNCMGMRCPEREKCFFMALRRECAESHILVVNHHLLFADLAARYEGAGYDAAVVLPPYTRIVLDEAHNIEKSATSFFSKEFSRLGILRALGRLYRKRRNQESGLLVKLAAALHRKIDEGESAVSDKIADTINKVRDYAEKVDDAALWLCGGNDDAAAALSSTSSGTVYGYGGSGVYRLVPGKARAAEEELFPHLADLRREITRLAALVRDVIEDSELSGKEAKKDIGTEALVRELKSVVRRLETVAGVCSAFAEYKENPDDVFWIEKNGGFRGEPYAVLRDTPVDVAPKLKEALFDAAKTVVCLSATLCTADVSGRREGYEAEDGSRLADPAAVEQAFAFWANRAGASLSERGLLLGAFPSPFPYSTRTLLAVPSDAPPPDADAQTYQEFVNNAVERLVLASGGSALVLFTSYSSLKKAYAAASPALADAGIRCLKQGGEDRSRLLAEFLADRESVLFATDSFWEGVDAPGETLRLVLICRLPFRMPNEPVFEARRELLEKRGGSAFMNLSLPDAVMKFKQGFGRLMRRSDDKGVVAVLDSRIIKKQYGRLFIAALPETRRSFRSLADVARDVERFLEA